MYVCMYVYIYMSARPKTPYKTHKTTPLEAWKRRNISPGVILSFSSHMVMTSRVRGARPDLCEVGTGAVHPSRCLAAKDHERTGAAAGRCNSDEDGGWCQIWPEIQAKFTQTKRFLRDFKICFEMLWDVMKCYEILRYVLMMSFCFRQIHVEMGPLWVIHFVGLFTALRPFSGRRWKVVQKTWSGWCFQTCVFSIIYGIVLPID